MDFFQSIGGSATCRKLSKAFYARVASDPLLRPLFPGKSFTCAIEEFSAFLVQFLGGPAEDSQRRWWLSLHESHRRFRIGAEHREAWLRLMEAALEDAGIEEPARGSLRDFFERSSAYVIDGPQAEGCKHAELAGRWQEQQALDQAVAAIRTGDAPLALELAEACSSAARPGLLAMMVESESPMLLDYVHGELARDGTLLPQRYAGRTLLHAAAAAGRLATVEQLLSLGADPNALDGGKHTPLYSVANECGGPEGSEVVRALVRAGARVDANEGAKRCTALHMAARRGNTAIAKALLECGAAIDARDSHGDTPLQRAINCRKPAMVEFLRSYF